VGVGGTAHPGPGRGASWQSGGATKPLQAWLVAGASHALRDISEARSRNEPNGSGLAWNGSEWPPFGNLPAICMLSGESIIGIWPCSPQYPLAAPA
jgi:hypothetical protein